MSKGTVIYNNKLTIKCVVILFVFMTPVIEGAQFVGGDGTEDNPYQISTIEQLQAMQDSLDAHYILLNDIDASVTAGWNDSAGFEPVGDDPENGTAFTGSFDGQGFVIRHLTINRPFEYCIGLFGYITSAEITSIVLDSVNVSGKREIGGLVGCNDSGIISGCSVTGVVRGNGYVGGIVGHNKGTVTNCRAAGEALGDTMNVGGLVGFNISGTISYCSATSRINSLGCSGGLVGYSYGTIYNCYAIGDVSGDWAGGLIGENDGIVYNCFAKGVVNGDYFAGGLVGYNMVRVSNCYSMADVSGSSTVGGLIGLCEEGGDNTVVSDCYSTGKVSGTGSTLGGLVGESSNSLVLNCLWDMEVSGIDTSSGGTGKNTSEMKNVVTFTKLSTAGLDTAWDFVGNPNDDSGKEDIWNINPDKNNGYPYLSWQDTVTGIINFVNMNNKTKEFHISVIPKQDIIEFICPPNSIVSIIDMQGRIVKADVKGIVNLSKLGNRLYFAVLKQKNKIVAVKKFINVR